VVRGGGDTPAAAVLGLFNSGAGVSPSSKDTQACKSTANIFTLLAACVLIVLSTEWNDTIMVAR